jgi:hypothetical protein
VVHVWVEPLDQVGEHVAVVNRDHVEVDHVLFRAVVHLKPTLRSPRCRASHTNQRPDTNTTKQASTHGSLGQIKQRTWPSSLWPLPEVLSSKSNACHNAQRYAPHTTAHAHDNRTHHCTRTRHDRTRTGE